MIGLDFHVDLTTDPSVYVMRLGEASATVAVGDGPPHRLAPGGGTMVMINPVGPYGVTVEVEAIFERDDAELFSSVTRLLGQIVVIYQGTMTVITSERVLHIHPDTRKV
jgi:hypothetical protein